MNWDRARVTSSREADWLIAPERKQRVNGKAKADGLSGREDDLLVYTGPAFAKMLKQGNEKC